MVQTPPPKPTMFDVDGISMGVTKYNVHQTQNHPFLMKSVQTPHPNKDKPKEEDEEDGLRCYRCGFKGHMLRHCRLKKEECLCTKCGKKGHLQTVCPKGPTEEVTTNFVRGPMGDEEENEDI